MGGDLTFESAPGVGTTFFFTARFALDAQRSVHRARRRRPRSLKKPALIVDDSATSRELLETLLRGWSIPPCLGRECGRGARAARGAQPCRTARIRSAWSSWTGCCPA